MNFMYYLRFLISSYIKLDLVIVVDSSYGLINITSSSSILSLFNSFYSSSLYNSCIS